MDPWFYKYFARPIIKAYVHIVYNPTIIGKDNIPKNGRCILAGNHTNNFDCILLISCTKRCIHLCECKSLEIQDSHEATKNGGTKVLPKP